MEYLSKITYKKAGIRTPNIEYRTSNIVLCGGEKLDLAWLLAVSVALGADAFSLALVIGLAGVDKRMILRLSILVAVFHIVMPLAGLLVGQTLGMVLGRLATGVGALVLIWLGARMLWHVYRPEPEHFPFTEARRNLFQNRLPAGVSLQGFGVYVLVASVSLDALSVGFSLGAVGSQIGRTVLIMGLTAGIMTGGGLILGRFIGTWLGEKAEVIGGITLILIGLKLFI